MDAGKVGSGVVLLGLVAWIGAAAVAFASGLLLDGDWLAITLATVAIYVGILGAIAVAGRPWRRWQRTPYW